MHPEKIFITGATGYIGHQLALAAANKGYAVHALVRDIASSNVPRHPAIRLFKGDITDYATVVPAMQGCTYVMHAAALAQMWNKDRSLFYKVNVEGTRHVLEACLQTGVKKMVLTSTCGVLGPSSGRPVSADEPRTTGFDNDYEISKHCAEELAMEYHKKGLHTVVVRPSRVYGPGLNTGANPINKLIRNVLQRGIAFIPAQKEAYGNYAFIDDVVYGHFRALQDGINGQRYNLGGENLAYDTFFKTIRAQSGRSISLVPVPTAVLQVWAACVFGVHLLIGKHTHMTPKVVRRLLQNRAVCSQKSIAELGYNITPFSQGIHRTIVHLKKSQHV